MHSIKDIFSRKITLWFLLLTLFMGVFTYAIYHSIHHLVEQTEWVSHTHEVMTEIQETLSQVKEVQAAQRGYVITGNLQYLDPYEAALPLLENALNRLVGLVSDNPEQTKRAQILAAEAKKRVLVAQDIITIYDNEGPSAAVAKIKTGIGKKEMDEARQIASDMEREEKILLEKRRKDALQALTFTLVVCGVSLFLCFLALGCIFHLMRKEITQRRIVQASLEELNQHIMLTNKLGELLQSCQNLAEASSVFKEYMVRLLPATQGAITLINNSRNQLEVMMYWGEEASTLVSDFSPDECWSLRSGKSHLVDQHHLNPVCPHIQNPPPTSLCMPMMAHGDIIGMLYVASAEPDCLDEAFQSKIRTVTEQAALALSNLKLQDTLRIQSIRDPLTLLFNRRYMEVTLEREISRAKRDDRSIGIILLDLDHFKRVNDNYGHEAGDAVLKEFGALLKKTIRTEDIACRYGGEEFIVILSNIPKEMAAKRAENLREAITQLTIHYRHQLLGPFTLSAGVAMYPADGDRVDTLVAAADTALYKAKETRDCVVITGD